MSAAEKTGTLAAGIELLHHDDSLLVFNKPSGLLSVPGRLPENWTSLAGHVQSVWPDALSVHRLDMETSGVIVMARGKAAHRALSIAFQERQVDKRYLAIVAGSLESESGEIDLPLICDWPNRPRQKIDFAAGKPSLTRYRVITRDAAQTRVALEPVTGRSHQLRVHLQTIGHPILGDVLYAPAEIVARSARLLLHAEWLAIPHPESGRRLEFHCPANF